MTILDATRICLRKAFVFQGRATRAEFWWFSGAVVLAFAAALGLDRLLFPVAMMRGMLPVSAGCSRLPPFRCCRRAGGGCRMSVGPGHQMLLPLLAYLGFVAALWMVSAVFFAVLRQRVYDPWLYDAVKLFGLIVFPAGAAVGFLPGF
jgi:uncharacterized membrane protein YhaH (DUF805 family)